MIKSKCKSPAPLRRNTRLLSAIEKLGLYDTYVLDDLVVENDNSFLLRSGKVGEEIELFFNEDSKESDRDAIVSKVIIAGEYSGLRIKMSGLYSLQPLEGDKIELNFRE